MSDNAIRAMLEEAENTNNSDDDDDAPDFPASPLTEAYHVVTGAVDLLRDVTLKTAQSAGHEVENPSDVTGSFNPTNYRDAADEAATAAMDASVFDEPHPIVGLLGAMESLKKKWGALHPEKVSGEGHHGAGLNTDGTYATVYDDSYGEAYPDAPHFDAMVGVEGLDGGERSVLEEMGIPVSDIGPVGNVLLPAPEGERIPVAFSEEDAKEKGYDSTLDQLAEVADRLNAMPEVPGPDEYDGPVFEPGETAEGDTSDEAADVTPEQDADLEGFPAPGEMTVKEIRGMATDITSLTTVERMLEMERDNGQRKGAIQRLTQRKNALEAEADEEEDEEADGDESDEGDTSDSVEADGDAEDERQQYVTDLIDRGVSPQDAEEAAKARFGE